MKINFYRDLLQQANLENGLAMLEELPTWKRPEALYRQTKTMVEEGRAKLVGCLSDQEPAGQDECCGSPSLGEEEISAEQELWNAFAGRTRKMLKLDPQFTSPEFEREIRKNVRVLCENLGEPLESEDKTGFSNADLKRIKETTHGVIE